MAKTTTSVSLGGALAMSGYETLLVDLDPQADLTLALGLAPARLRGVIADVLLHSSSLKEITRETAIPGLDLVASNNDLELAERFLPMRPNFETLLRDVLASHLPAGFYDFVILDCPPAISSVTLNALNAANALIIPTQPEYFSAHALRNMIPLIRRVRANVNPDLLYRILITMHDRRNRIHRNLSEQLRGAFGEGVWRTVIDVDTKLRESSLAGLPITHYNPKSRSALQYQALAQEFIQYVQETAGKTAAQAAG
ncbi:MAG: ParA family protein [Chloroflexi bacterium]|nr:ParA family protein [Chloroflexota bacterium]